MSAPFPLRSGRYDVLPGMTPLGQRAVTGEVEEGHFRVDDALPRYLADRLVALEEDADGVCCVAETRRPGLEELLWRTFAVLAAEHPGLAAIVPEGVELRLHGLVLGRDGSLGFEAPPAPGFERLAGEVRRWLAGRHGIARLADALALTVQEDFAVVDAGPAGPRTTADRLELLHVAFPSGWDPREKIGGHFAAVHQPVPGADAILRAHANLVQAMVTKGPFVRFTWGIATDLELNHNPHRPVRRGTPIPEPLLSEPAAVATRCALRVERQTTRPFPDLDRALFTIRTWVTPVVEVARDRERRSLLASALASMSDASAAYKGVSRVRGPLVAWLEGG